MKEIYGMYLKSRNSLHKILLLAYSMILLLLQIQILQIAAADWYDVTFDATAIYKRCVFGSVKDVPDQPPVLIRTIGAKCYALCDSNCKDAFKIVDVDPKEDDGDQLSYIQALKNENADLIEQCFKQCVSGNTFSAGVRIPEQYPNVTAYDAINTKSCQKDSESYIAELSASWPYKIDMRVNKDDIISLTNMPDADYFSEQQLIEDIDDSIYLCGYETKQIFPNPYSVGNKDTGEEGKVPPGTDPWLNVETNPMKINNNEVWHARSAAWFNTKLYPHDGDFLQITYGGQFLNCLPSAPLTPNKCQYNPDSYDLEIHKPSIYYDWIWGYNLYGEPNDHLTLRGSDLSMETYFLNPSDYQGQDNDALANAMSALQKEDSQKNANLINKTNLGLNLTGGFGGNYYKYKRNIQFEKMNKSYNHDNYRIQTFSGYLKDYSSSMSALGIRHHSDYSSNEKPWYKNWLQNVGGYFVQIKWRGCRYQNGKQLEFIVVPEEKIDEDDYLSEYFAQTRNWHDVTTTTSKSGKEYATIDLSKVQELSNNDQENNKKYGFVYVRVKTINPKEYHDWEKDESCVIMKGICDAVDQPYIPSCDNAYNRCVEVREYSKSSETYARSNTIGKYALVATKTSKEQAKEICGISADIIKLFCQKLFGEKCNANDCKYCSTTGSIVSQTFKLIVSDNIFVSAVRALLTLFVAWIGLSIALGMTKMQHKEGLLIIIKIGIVLTLISPTSWDFFYQYIFGVVIEGMQDLMTIFFYRIPNAPYKEVCLKWLPILISFDDLMDEFASSANWMRVLSLFFSSLTGMVIALFLTISFCFAFLAIIQTLIMIIMALISIALMIILSPLFFSFLLFKQTSGMSRKWFKQTLIFVLQPVTLCGALSVFIGIVIILIKSMLSFTYCNVCFIKVNLIAFTMCIGNKPIPLFTLHSPDEFYIPMSMLSSILVLGALCHALYILPSLVSQIIGHIVDIGAVKLGQMGGATSIAGAITSPMRSVLGATMSPYNALMTLIGRDEKSRSMRRDIAEKKATEMDNEPEDKKAKKRDSSKSIEEKKSSDIRNQER